MNDPLLGRMIAQRYRLISRLGAGGMASVYLARHVMIDRLSAIKLVHPELRDDPIYRRRFLREAKAVNRINHPNIVEITDYGEVDGLMFLVMEYVPGESMQRALDRAPFGWRSAAMIGLQLASALGRAHQMGVVHRDLKPANILLLPRRDAEPIAKLTDFGVAKLMDATTVTGEPIAMGTPGYVAPESRTLGAVDARSDLYSLGVVLYEATCGARPLDAMREQTLVPQPLPRLSVRCPEVPRFFCEVVMTLLAEDPDDRPRDGFEAYDLIARVLSHEGVLVGPAPSGHRTVPPGRPSRPSAIPADPPSGIEASRQRGPHIATVAFDRIAPFLERAVSELENRISQAGSSAPLGAREVFEEARKTCTMAEAIATMCAQDSEAIERAQAAGRALRAELGGALDELGRERSRALGWAGTIAERSFHVEARRSSGELSVGASDAMVWEQAALEAEEDRVRATAEELGQRITAAEAELERRNERLERDLVILSAQLEGRIAALRALAMESWAAMKSLAALLEIDPEGLVG
jgi:serine/threonine-protein kinase